MVELRIEIESLCKYTRLGMRIRFSDCVMKKEHNCHKKMQTFCFKTMHETRSEVNVIKKFEQFSRQCNYLFDASFPTLTLATEIQ